MAEQVSQWEAPALHGIEISQAQRIAQNGFIDGIQFHLLLFHPVYTDES